MHMYVLFSTDEISSSSDNLKIIVIAKDDSSGSKLIPAEHDTTATI